MELDRMDSEFAHLLEVKEALLARWKTQRYSRILRKRISEINTTKEACCKVLCMQQWDELCDSIQGQLNAGTSWRLKHLLCDSNTTSNHKRALAKAVPFDT